MRQKKKNTDGKNIYYRDVLSVGSSMTWPDIIRQMTRGRTNRIDAGAILRYFQPLAQFLKRHNQIEPVIGWVTNQEDAGLFVFFFIITVDKMFRLFYKPKSFLFVYSSVCPLVSWRRCEHHLFYSHSTSNGSTASNALPDFISERTTVKNIVRVCKY